MRVILYLMPPIRGGTFRINAKFFFLTYPQCDASKQDLLTFLQSIAPVKYAIIGQEQHEDGGRHLHALVEFAKKFDCRNQTRFDLSVGQICYHPNIQSARDPHHVRNYCCKEDREPLEFGTFGRLEYSDLLLLDSRDAFLEGLAKHHARDYVLQYERILKFATTKYASQEKDYQTPYTEFTNLPVELTNWCSRNFEVRTLSGIS